MSDEQVNHPAHYGGDTTYETIKVIDAWGLGFALGNAVKYISRAALKGDALTDLRKARFYLNHAITALEGGEALKTEYTDIDYDEWSYDALRVECRERGEMTTGAKDVLIERLRSNDRKHA